MNERLLLKIVSNTLANLNYFLTATSDLLVDVFLDMHRSKRRKCDLSDQYSYIVRHNLNKIDIHCGGRAIRSSQRRNSRRRLADYRLAPRSESCRGRKKELEIRPQT